MEQRGNEVSQLVWPTGTSGMSYQEQERICVVRAMAALFSSIGSLLCSARLSRLQPLSSNLQSRLPTIATPLDIALVSIHQHFPHPTHRSQRFMASAIMASHAVAAAGLGSSMLRTSHIKGLRGSLKVGRNSSRQMMSPIRAAKLPQGVGSPKDEPKLPVPFWGFTENAEAWNSRASMIGIFGIIIVEALINKGILQAIGIEVGNGLDLPL